MIFKVTQDDIVNGRQRNPGCCPIALAFVRSGYKSVTVGTDKVWLAREVEDTAVVRTLPAKVKAFIALFDDEKPVKPIAFSLRRL